MRTFDVVVIGAGPAGEVAAGRLSGHGLSVAIVEEELVGGECSYWACMPSKGLLRPGEVLAEARRVPGAAEAITGSLDVQAVLRRRDEIVHDFTDDAQLPWLEDRGVELIRGRATVVGERRVRVGGEELAAGRAVIVATGSSALIPPVDGLSESRPWTNREATAARQIPARLVIVGAGVVGVEMAQAFRTLGAAVDVLDRGHRVLAREEPFAGEQVADALRARGVRIHHGASARRVRRAEGEVVVDLEDGRRLTADQILVATGRRPRTAAVEELGYEAGAPIETDEHLRSHRHDWLYAIGDVNGHAPFTHMGKYQARLVADHLAGRPVPAQTPHASGKSSPRVIFTDPQVAAVGHTLASAQNAGLPVRCVDVETSGNAGGSFYGRGSAGTARMVVDTERETIVGATITGAEAGEMLHGATIAVAAQVPLDQLWHAVPAFPTRSELWLQWLEGYGR